MRDENILIVDDEEGMRESLTFMLETEGISAVRTAGDGEQALQELERNPSEVVITDLVMPRMNGYALMQAIKERWPNTLVIAITGFGSTDSATQCLRRGAFDYITKPFEMDVMLNVIRRALDRVRLEAEARRRAEQIAAMVQIARIINSDLDIQAVYPPFIEEVKRILDFDHMTVALMANGHGELSVLASTAPEASPLGKGKSLPLEASFLGSIVLAGQVRTRGLVDEGPRAIDEEVWANEGIKSIAAVPLVAKNRVIGTFCVGSRKENAYGPQESTVVGQIGELVATAANNALLYQRIQSQLVTLRQTQAQLIRSARLAAVGELADGVAHEINNPLSVILGVTQLLLRDDNVPSFVKEDLERVAQSANRVAQIIRTFIEFAKPATVSNQVPLDITALLESSLLLVRTQLESASKPISVQTKFEPNLPRVMGNESQLQVAFVNIIRNAFEAMAKTSPPPTGHTLTLQAVLRAGNEGPVVEVTVEDTGCGIPAKDLTRIFEPGFTTKVDRGTIRGLGMGLFSAYGSIDAHGGKINIESEPGHGTRVIVTLRAMPLE